MSPVEQLTIDEALTKAKRAVKLGKHAVAAELYSAVLRQQPNHPLAKKGLRKLQRVQPTKSRISEPAQERTKELVALLQAGQMEKAEQISRAMLAEFPKSLVVINVLGIALQRQDRLSEAIDIFDKAIELSPGIVETWVNRGIALKELGRVDEAIASYDKAIKLKPDYAEAHFNRANVLKDIGRFDEAVTAYERAVAVR
ncbi:MAG: tetratricopeptide repeat protein, partial [Pseudomonadales bacterium]